MRHDPLVGTATALACALMGGIFFAFSSFVMRALCRIPAEEGIRAMQRINIDVFHWTFMDRITQHEYPDGRGS